MRLVKSLLIGFAGISLLASCSAGGDDQGTEYAPNMYHSVAYEPYKQITDKEAGRWVTSIEYPDNHAEYYNSNNFNPFRMNMRTPPANTVKRNAQGWLPYRLPNDSTGLRLADRLKNPLDSTVQVLSDGKALYEMYCDHCHGAKGEGDGKVASGVKVDGKDKSAYAGVPNYKSDALKGITEGHIFHVITYGKNLMWPHGSQIAPEDRWKIAKYVKTLQK
ncbi:c-type cytochrome [Chryseosolibacter indicus]|uniref:C-type cytochrome n=1 Tax=Chryseosolibacter indicus TaxID=2782351 RepID=A0ABS5VUY5_9BACT|nr:cytochrome c [Chryseosolibacter indicus]MBT1705234.1 c-type cytochrome [Chryseosolibacter indicus]